MKEKPTKTIKPPRGISKDPDFVSKFKGVARYIHPIHDWVWYSARVGTDFAAYYDTEIEAARQVDRVRICRNLSPVNTFKQKLVNN